MRVLALTRYGPMGASSRMRTFQFLPFLESAGMEVEVSPFFSDQVLARKYNTGEYPVRAVLRAYCKRISRLLERKEFDLIWIEKEALPWLPSTVERWLLRGVPYVMDFDDAVFHNYDRHHRAFVRMFLGRRLDRLMASARLLVVGNKYLAQRAIESGASRVEIIPTVVDLSRYVVPTKSTPELPRIVWIGSPSTVRYLRRLARPLALLAAITPFKLRIIGGGPVDMPGVDIEFVTWSVETEVESIASCQVGIMPLDESQWEKGKCAYKLIQYMACGLPTVASPVGANSEVVVDGETGYLAYNECAWIQKLKLLLDEPALRDRLGSAGRARVESMYSLERAAPRLIEILRQTPECTVGASNGLSS